MSATLSLLHRQHATHRFFLAAALAVAIFSFVGIVLTVVRTTKAATVLMSLTVSEPSPVEAQPAVGVPGGGPPSMLAYLASPPPPSDEADTTEGQSVTPLGVAIRLATQNGDLFDFRDVTLDTQASFPRFSDGRPVFSGEVDMPNALLFLELHSEPTNATTVSLNADAQGRWSWQPPRPIDPGVHYFYLSVFDPTGEIRLAQSSFKFELLSTALTTQIPEPTNLNEPRTTVDIPHSLVDERQILFDVRVEVIGKQDTKQVNPGDDILAMIHLLNIGAPGKLVDAVVEYRLINQDNVVVFDQSETIAVATQASYLKAFRTKPTLPRGSYELEVTVSYGNTKASAHDNVLLNGSAVFALPGNTTVDVSFVFQLLMVILTIAILFAYFEHKQVEALGAKIHQVTEDDLRQQGMFS